MFYFGRDIGVLLGDDKLLERKKLGYIIYYLEDEKNNLVDYIKKINFFYNDEYLEFRIISNDNIFKYVIVFMDYDVENVKNDFIMDEIYNNNI